MHHNSDHFQRIGEKCEFISEIKNLFRKIKYLEESDKKNKPGLAPATGLRHVRRELKDSEIRYRRLFESAMDGVLILNAVTGNIVDVNPYLTELLSYSHDELLGKKLWEIGSFKDVASSKTAFKKLQKKGYVRYEDLPLETKNGKKIDVEFVSNVYLADDEKVIQCNIRNITEHKRAELKVLESQKALRMLMVRLQETQELEQKKLSSELHDEIGQALTSIKIDLAIITKSLPKDCSEGILGRLNEIDSIIDNILMQIHEMALHLYPHMLDELGLIPTLRWYTKMFTKRLNIELELKSTGFRGRMDSVSETILYRVCQEALTNIAKHAQAKKIVIKVCRRKSVLELSILDDGIGFNVSKTEKLQYPKHGIGLLGIRERILSIQGNFKIESAPDRGTRLYVTVPWRKREHVQN